jgi:hypothetical protein
MIWGEIVEFIVDAAAMTLSWRGFLAVCTLVVIVIGIIYLVGA